MTHEGNAEPINEFTLEEKQTKTSYFRRVQGKLTNTAFGDAASVFSGNTSTRRPSVSVSPVHDNHQMSLPLSISEPTFGEEGSSAPMLLSDNASKEIVISAQQASSPKERAALYFEPDGDGVLVSIVSDFKGKNKGEQQQRYMLLFVNAYNHHFKRVMPSEKAVFSAMRECGMFDANCYNYFGSVAAKYLVKIDAGYKINLDGGNRLEEIVHEVEDRTIAGFRDWDKPGKPRNRSGKTDGGEVASWIDMHVEMDGFDIRLLKKPTHYALFGYWLLTKKLEVAKAIKPNVVYEFLKRKYVAISVTSRTFSGALNRPYNASFFQRTSEGLFYLTPEGEKRVLDWLQGAPIQDTVGEDQENGDEA
ncbi:hypothetical protein SD80_012855 [Scytonema tolypothrichoides VB-61278]|nr:hypothetical protein SD80_012855 [Scytonema tolypothrichoides VB-61278]